MKKVLLAGLMILVLVGSAFGAATISIKEVNGASSGTPTTVTAVRLCTTDSYNPTTSYPLVKPASSYNYSYWKQFYLNADTSPTGTINNIKWYADGTIGWTGVVLYAGVCTNYVQATGTQGATGNEAHASHSDTPTMTDASTYTPSAPLSVTGSISNPSTGKISQYVIIQGRISTSAVSGTLGTETITWKYDET